MRWQNLLIALYILELLPDVVVSAQFGGLRLVLANILYILQILSLVFSLSEFLV